MGALENRQVFKPKGFTESLGTTPPTESDLAERVWILSSSSRLSSHNPLEIAAGDRIMCLVVAWMYYEGWNFQHDLLG